MPTSNTDWEQSTEAINLKTPTVTAPITQLSLSCEVSYIYVASPSVGQPTLTN